MGFVKTQEEILKNYMDKFVFYDAEALTIFFETEPEIVKNLLPAPLKPAATPMGIAFAANYPETNFGVSYMESAIFLTADYEGEQGIYCLSMPVDNDIALIGGREIFGFPKKMASIHLGREGDEAWGWTERHGIRFFEAKASLSGNFNDSGAQSLIIENMKDSPDMICYNFKFFSNPERTGFDYKPRLVRDRVTQDKKLMHLGDAELILRPSHHDPWHQVKVKKVYGATYTVSTNTMLPGSVLTEVEEDEFMPYAFMKMDEVA